MTDEGRWESYRDSLDDEEQVYADRIKTMPGGSHAVAFIAVEQRRSFKSLDARMDSLDARMDSLEKRTVWKDAVKMAGALSTGVAATIGALLANSHGVPLSK